MANNFQVLREMPIKKAASILPDPQPQNVDEIDGNLIQLLLRRFDIAQQISIHKRKAKLPVLDASRESEILSRIAGIPNKAISTKLKYGVFLTIFDVSREIQRADRDPLNKPALGQKSHRELIAKLRIEINEIDNQLVRLLDERMKIAQTCGLKRMERGKRIYLQSHLKSVRKRIDQLDQDSDTKQWIWKVYSSILEQ